MDYNILKELKECKDFYMTKNNMQKNIILAVLYDENNLPGIEYWNTFLCKLYEKFKETLLIYVCSNNEKNKKLFSIFLSMKGGENINDPNFDKMKLLEGVQYPCVAIGVPHRTDIFYSVGIQPFSLYKIIENFHNFLIKDFENEKEKMFAVIKKILDNYPIVVFIKGTPNNPFCKFSTKFVNLLNDLKVKYKAINIFEDEKLRCYLRFYQNWKTYPQLYINGKIIGGVDKLSELVDNKEIYNLLPKDI